MKCQFCSAVAGVFVVDIVERKKRELRLCDDCAAKHHLFHGQKQELNLAAVLSLLGEEKSESAEQEPESVCPTCGMTYNEFRKTGRFGCPHDYEVFRTRLIPLLDRIHRGVQHTGKVPKRCGNVIPAVLDRDQLLRHLRAAVDAERYEDAARLRDLIRGKEATDESGQPAADAR